MIHHAEDDSVSVLVPDNLLDGLGVGDEESLLNVVVDQLPFVTAREQHVTKFLQSLISLPRVCADPDDPQSQRERNVVAAVWRMTGGREEILAPVSFLSVQVRVYPTIADTEGCVKEGH